MWSRVFCRSAAEVPPAALAERLHAAGVAVEPHFRGDDLGWTSAELRLPGGGEPVAVERYLTREDDIRTELNTFAAVLETRDSSPHHRPLMEHVIQTQQLVTIHRSPAPADEAALDTVVTTLCQSLAAAADGVYQIDGRGWFAADGTLLLQEN